MNKLSTFIASAVFALATSSVSANSGAELDSRWIDNKDGTVTDTTTGIIWFRCLGHQKWEDGKCSNIVLTPERWAAGERPNQLMQPYIGVGNLLDIDVITRGDEFYGGFPMPGIPKEIDPKAPGYFGSSSVDFFSWPNHPTRVAPPADVAKHTLWQVAYLPELASIRQCDKGRQPALGVIDPSILIKHTVDSLTGTQIEIEHGYNHVFEEHQNVSTGKMIDLADSEHEPWRLVEVIVDSYVSSNPRIRNGVPINGASITPEGLFKPDNGLDYRYLPFVRPQPTNPRNVLFSVRPSAQILRILDKCSDSDETTLDPVVFPTPSKAKHIAYIWNDDVRSSKYGSESGNHYVTNRYDVKTGRVLDFYNHGEISHPRNHVDGDFLPRMESGEIGVMLYRLPEDYLPESTKYSSFRQFRDLFYMDWKDGYFNHLVSLLPLHHSRHSLSTPQFDEAKVILENLYEQAKQFVGKEVALLCAEGQNTVGDPTVTCPPKS